MGRGMGRGMGGGGKGEYWLVELVDTYALVCMLILLSTVCTRIRRSGNKSYESYDYVQ